MNFSKILRKPIEEKMLGGNCAHFSAAADNLEENLILKFHKRERICTVSDPF
jgi:hypothetical protein